MRGWRESGGLRRGGGGTGNDGPLRFLIRERNSDPPSGSDGGPWKADSNLHCWSKHTEGGRRMYVLVLDGCGMFWGNFKSEIKAKESKGVKRVEKGKKEKMEGK